MVKKLSQCQKKKLKGLVEHKGSSRVYTGNLSKPFTASGWAPHPFVQKKPVKIKRGTPVIITKTMGSLGTSIIIHLPNCNEASAWNDKVPLTNREEHFASWEK